MVLVQYTNVRIQQFVTCFILFPTKNSLKERLPAQVRDLFIFSSKVIKSFIIV
jgi:hypothetical protein